MPDLEAPVPTCLPPCPASRPRSLIVPPGAWETHAHVIGTPDRYPFVSGRHFDAPAARPEAFIALLDQMGLDYGVLVQVSVHGTANALLTETLTRYPDRLRGIAVIDEAIGEAELARLDAAGVVGIRVLDIVGGGVGLANLERLAAICAELGWHVQIGLKGENYPHLTNRLMKLPVPFVIDHMGWCMADRGVDSPEFTAVQNLVRNADCYVKLSGGFRLSAEAAPWQDTWPFARRLLEQAPHRMLWGSDWPHVGLYAEDARPDVGALLDWLALVAPDPEVQRQVLVDNPAQLYGVPGPLAVRAR